VDKLPEIEIGTDVGAIGHDAGHVPEMPLQSMQNGAVPLADKAGESLAALMGAQAPRAAIGMWRQSDKGREEPVETGHHGVGGDDIDRPRVDDTMSAHRQPKL